MNFIGLHFCMDLEQTFCVIFSFNSLTFEFQLICKILILTDTAFKNSFKTEIRLIKENLKVWVELFLCISNLKFARSKSETITSCLRIFTYNSVICKLADTKFFQHFCILLLYFFCWIVGNSVYVKSCYILNFFKPKYATGKRQRNFLTTSNMPC